MVVQYSHYQAVNWIFQLYWKNSEACANYLQITCYKTVSYSFSTGFCSFLLLFPTTLFMLQQRTMQYSKNCSCLFNSCFVPARQKTSSDFHLQCSVKLKIKFILQLLRAKISKWNTTLWGYFILKYGSCKKQEDAHLSSQRTSATHNVHMTQ